MAHATILGITKPSGLETLVFTAQELDGVKPIRAVSGLKGFKPSEQPILARDKVRQVGELVAMCVAPTRAEAEDLADATEVDFEELPAVVDMLEARLNPPALVHEQWGDNIFSNPWWTTTSLQSQKDAAVTVTRKHAHRAPAHVADGRPRRGVRVEPAARAARDAQRGADAAHQPRRPRRVPRHRPGRDPRGRARRRRRLRLQGHPAARGGRARVAVPRSLGRPVRWIEDRREQLIGERQLPRAPLRPHAVRRRARDDLLGIDCEATRRLRRLFVLSLLGLPRGRAGRARSCPARTRWSATAAAPGRSRPTSRRSCPTAAWRAPACASRSR